MNGQFQARLVEHLKQSQPIVAEKVSQTCFRVVARLRRDVSGGGILHYVRHSLLPCVRGDIASIQNLILHLWKQCGKAYKVVNTSLV